MTHSDFITSVEFADGTKVTLGGGGELYIEQTDKESASCLLNEDRLALIRALQSAEENSVG